MRKLIPKLAIYFLALKVIVMMIIITVDRKQIRELKDKYQTSINTVDSLYKQSIDPSALWFQSHIPEDYEVMEHAVMNYDWGKEIIVFFKYTK
jgi:hypothetical protein